MRENFCDLREKASLREVKRNISRTKGLKMCELREIIWSDKICNQSISLAINMVFFDTK